MKSKKRLLLSVFVIVILSLLLTIPTFAKPKLNKKNVTLQVGQAVKLRVTGRGKQKVKWRSSNEDVAFVDSGGIVETFEAGTAIVRAKVGKTTLKCKVTVKGAPAPTPTPTPTPAPVSAPVIELPSLPTHVVCNTGLQHEFDLEQLNIQNTLMTNNTYRVNMILTAVKTGEKVSFPLMHIPWRLYDSNNVVVATSNFSVLNIRVGDRFTTQSAISNLKAGSTYRLELG